MSAERIKISQTDLALIINAQGRLPLDSPPIKRLIDQPNGRKLISQIYPAPQGSQWAYLQSSDDVVEAMDAYELSQINKKRRPKVQFPSLNHAVAAGFNPRGN